MKLITSIIIVILLAGCSSNNDKTVYEIDRDYFSSGTNVRDLLVSLFLQAPKLKRGISREELVSRVLASGGHIVADYEYTVIAEYSTADTALEKDYAVCYMAYGLEADEYQHGPKVIGDCSSLEITGSRIN